MSNFDTAYDGFHTDGEARAMDAIIEAMIAIQEIDGGKKLAYNQEELASSIHVLQSFVKQHILHRLDPEWYSDWWNESA